MEPPEPKIELESEWQREKAAKQEAAQRPPPKPPLKIIGVIVAVLLMVGAAVAIVMLAKGEPASGGASSNERVRIEIRSMPVAKIRLGGRELGRTPVTIIKPRTTTAFTIEATMVTYGMSGAGQPMNKEYTVTRSIVPDRDQTVDLKPEGRGTLVPPEQR